MKYFQVLLIAVFLCQGSKASPDPLLFDIIGQAAQGFGNAAQAVGGIASGIAGAAGDITKGFVDAGTGITQGLISGAANITSGIAQGVQQASTAIGQRLANATASFREVIDNVRNSIGGSIFNAVSDQISNRLSQIESRLNDSLATASEKYNEAVQKINETLTSSVSSLDSWSSEQMQKLENASNDNKDKVEDLINEFYLNSTAKLLNCSIQAVQPIQDLYNQTQSAVNGSVPVLNEIVDRTRACTNQRPINVFQVTSCIINVRQQLPSATQISLQATTLQLRIAAVNIGNIQSTGCFPQASADIEQGKTDVASQIDSLAAGQ